MARDTEQLVVALEARIRDFERNFQKASRTAGQNFDQIERRSRQATKRLEDQMNGISSRMIGIGKSMAAGFAGGLLAGGLAGILGRGGDLARGIAQIGDEAKRAGLSFTAFQELKYVAEQNRVGVDALTDGIKELNLRADEFIMTGGGSAAEAFARLGYDAETLRTKLVDPSALFTEIIGKLGQLDRAAQIRIADEIFGGTGGERFVQLIEQGEAALNDTKREAHELGIILSDDVITKADELDRRFNAVSNTVGSALKQAIVGATLALVDFINTFNSLPAMANLRAATAPLAERSLSIMQDQLASKEAALDRSLANPGTSGWFGTSLGVEADQEALRTEISALTDAINNRQDPTKFDVDGIFAGLDTPTYDSVDALKGALTPEPLPTIAPIAPASIGPRGGGGGASSMREQRDAAAELIAELENELRLIGMSEVQKQVDAELRRAGANATDDQKQSITQLVTAIETETAAMEQLEQASENAKGMAKDFLGGIVDDLRNGVDGATALANAFSRLADRLMDMALGSLIDNLFAGMGSGGLGGLLGFRDGGVVKAASGGLIAGPGTSTSDSIPARLSDGEFVVNAAAIRQNLDLLRAINSGQVQAFADGGLVGKSSFARTPAPSISIGDINVTTQGSSGDRSADEENAKVTAKAIDAMLEKKISRWAANQSRPGGIISRTA